MSIRPVWGPDLCLRHWNVTERPGLPPLSSPEAVVHVDPDLLESQLRIARLMSYGPLTDEPGA